MKTEFTIEIQAMGIPNARVLLETGIKALFPSLSSLSNYVNQNKGTLVFTAKYPNVIEPITVSYDPKTGKITFEYAGPNASAWFTAPEIVYGLRSNNISAREIETQSSTESVAASQTGVASTHSEVASNLAEVRVRINPEGAEPSVIYQDLDRVLGDFFPDFEEGGMRLTDTGFECTNPDKAGVAEGISITYLSATGELSIRGPRSVFENRGINEETLSDALADEGFEIAVEDQATVASAVQGTATEMAEVRVNVASGTNARKLYFVVNTALISSLPGTRESSGPRYTGEGFNSDHRFKDGFMVLTDYTENTGALVVKGPRSAFEANGFTVQKLKLFLSEDGIRVFESQAIAAPARQDAATEMAEVRVNVASGTNSRILYIAVDVAIATFFPKASEYSGSKYTGRGDDFNSEHRFEDGSLITTSYTENPGRNELVIKGSRRKFEAVCFTAERLGYRLRDRGIGIIRVGSACKSEDVWSSIFLTQPVPQDPLVGKTQNLHITLGRVPTDADVQLIARKFFEQRFNLRQNEGGTYSFVSCNYEGRIRLDTANRRISIEFHIRMPGVSCPTTDKIEKDLIRASKTPSLIITVGKKSIDPAKVGNLTGRFFPELEEAGRVEVTDETKGRAVMVKFRPKGTTENPTLKVIFYMDTGEVAIVGSQKYIDAIQRLVYDSETGRSAEGMVIARTLLSVPPKIQQESAKSGKPRERWQTEMSEYPSVTIRLLGTAVREDLVAFSLNILPGFSREEIRTESTGFRGAGEQVSCLWTNGVAKVMAVTDIAAPSQIRAEQLPEHAKEIVVYSDDSSVLGRIRSEGEKFAATRARPGQQDQKPVTSFAASQSARPKPAESAECRRQFTGGGRGSGGIV